MDQIDAAHDVLLAEGTPLPIEDITYQPVNGEVYACTALISRGDVKAAVRYGMEYEELSASVLINDEDVFTHARGQGDVIVADDGTWTVNEIILKYPENAGLIVHCTLRKHALART